MFGRCLQSVSHRQSKLLIPASSPHPFVFAYLVGYILQYFLVLAFYVDVQVIVSGKLGMALVAFKKIKITH